MELKWISPLDPSQTDVARYSSKLVPRLQQHAPIVEVSDASSDTVPDWWPGPVEGATGTEGQEPLAVYNIGNNPLHLSIWRRSLTEPGLVILHDTSLVDLAKYTSIETDRPELWKSMLLQQYGEEVRELANRSEKSPGDHSRMVQQYPLFLPFVDNAIGVIVHSAFARELLLQALPDGASVLHLELPAPPPPPVPDRDYAADTLRFVFCGHAGPNRRLVQFFEAWGSLEDRQRIRLDICGHIPNKRELMRYASHYGVAEYLEFRGFVDEETLEDAFRSAHFALNLRWPTMGETSGSQLRYWAAGLPTLVTDVGWYRGLPDDAVCKISPEREIEDIRELLASTLADAGRFQEVGLRGWETVSSAHSYDAYISKLVEFAAGCLERRLAFKTLEQGLVRTIASMCGQASDTVLFRGAIDSAVATLGMADPALVRGQ